tara:strand:- start:3146 stop:3628 length:483 start_codon:yes stop_codon:yes gene_type:complete
MLTLFPHFVTGEDAEQCFIYLLEERKPGALVKDFAAELFRGVIKEYETLDILIAANLKNWNMQRLGNLEKVILRVASYELRHKVEVPATVVINEAVQLTESYCDEKAAKFVNGVLAGVAKQLDRDPLNDPGEWIDEFDHGDSIEGPLDLDDEDDEESDSY